MTASPIAPPAARAERPLPTPLSRAIVFSGAMLDAIDRGEKSQTRRLVDLSRSNGLPAAGPGEVLDLWYPGGRAHYGHVLPEHFKPSNWQVQRLCSEACEPSPPGVYPPTGHADWRLGEPDDEHGPVGPYDGRHPVSWGPLPFWPGLRLWVKETFVRRPRSYRGRIGPVSPDGKETVFYKRDFDDRVVRGSTTWTSSRFMPRWASRMELVVTAVRPERLTAISEADARAEGIAFPDVPTICPCRTRMEVPRPPHVATCPWRDLDFDPLPGRPYASEYALLWNRLHRKKNPWSTDPFVWVITFARISP